LKIKWIFKNETDFQKVNQFWKIYLFIYQKDQLICKHEVQFFIADKKRKRLKTSIQ